MGKKDSCTRQFDASTTSARSGARSEFRNRHRTESPAGWPVVPGAQTQTPGSGSIPACHAKRLPRLTATRPPPHYAEGFRSVPSLNSKPLMMKFQSTTVVARPEPPPGGGIGCFTHPSGKSGTAT
jgi:hypothetical protein